MHSKNKQNNKRRFSPTLVIIILCSLLVVGGNLFSSFGQSDNEEVLQEEADFLFSEERFLVASSGPHNPPLKVVSEFETVITAYSSTHSQTDGTPFITASNKKVADGIIANNYFPFGTKVKIPELYGDKIFVVEDRMNSRKSNYQFDIWFADHQEAINFGAQRTTIEILGR
jgi:3D (Asp-Asp-Asp) domain-containing protein